MMGTAGVEDAPAREVQVVLITAPSADVAETLVRTLVHERLAACGNVVAGVTSIYRWRDTVHTESEVLAILKTTAECVPALLSRAPELHPYDVPEVLVLPVAAGHAAYLAWVRASSGGVGGGN
ncbi:MAG: divalent-cation tolerance protein CutA [Gemmatimonadales bacterium]